MEKQNWDLGKAYRTATILNDIGEMSYCCAILEDEKYYCKKKIWNYPFKKKNWSLNHFGGLISIRKNKNMQAKPK